MSFQNKSNHINSSIFPPIISNPSLINNSAYFNDNLKLPIISCQDNNSVEIQNNSNIPCNPFYNNSPNALNLKNSKVQSSTKIAITSGLYKKEHNFMNQNLNLKNLKTPNSSLNFNGKIQNSKTEDMKYFNGNGTHLNNLMNSNIQNSINFDENHQNSENLKNSNSNGCKKNLNLRTENSNLNTSANIVSWNDC